MGSTDIQQAIPSAPTGYKSLAILGRDSSALYLRVRRDSDSAEFMLSVLNRRLAGDAARTDRLRRGIGNLAAHPHQTAVRTTELKVAPGYVGILSELPDGVSLSDLIGDGALPIEASLVVLSDCLDALAWAEPLGVAHGDVRPGAIYVDAGGRVRMAGFGIQTHSFEVITEHGDRRWRAPELDRGGRPGAASDIYSLCAVVRHGLTMVGDQRASANRLRAPLNPVEFGVAASILEEGLAPEPSGRPLSADALQQTLELRGRRQLGRDWTVRGRQQLAAAVGDTRRSHSAPQDALVAAAEVVLTGFAVSQQVNLLGTASAGTKSAPVVQRDPQLPASRRLVRRGRYASWLASIIATGVAATLGGFALVSAHAGSAATPGHTQVAAPGNSAPSAPLSARPNPIVAGRVVLAPTPTAAP